MNSTLYGKLLLVMKGGKMIKIFQKVGNFEDWKIIKIFQKVGNYECQEDDKNIPKGWLL